MVICQCNIRMSSVGAPAGAFSSTSSMETERLTVRLGSHYQEGGTVNYYASDFVWNYVVSINPVKYTGHRKGAVFCRGSYTYMDVFIRAAALQTRRITWRFRNFNFIEARDQGSISGTWLAMDELAVDVEFNPETTKIPATDRRTQELYLTFIESIRVRAEEFYRIHFLKFGAYIVMYVICDPESPSPFIP